MTYLRHFEFGLDHKFWNTPNKYNNSNNLNYWIEQWLLFYEMIYLNCTNNKSCKILIYENLCQKENMDDLFSDIKINVKTDFLFKLKEKINTDINFDKKLYDKALGVYSKFQTL